MALFHEFFFCISPFQQDFFFKSTEKVCATILIKLAKAPEKSLDMLAAVKWRGALH